MKLLVIGEQKRFLKFMPQDDYIKQIDIIYLPRDYRDEDILKVADEVEAIFMDPISHMDRHIIEQMPQLKLIHSEGVAFDKIDLDACNQRGIYVCNCKGANAIPVAEQTILLMMALLRNAMVVHQAVLDGQQIVIKEKMMVDGILELGDCKIGLIGFGDIAKAVALCLQPFSSDLYYYKPHRASQDIEDQYHVQYLDLDSLIETCDIISIHCPVTDDTKNMVNEQFLKKMKKTAYLVNTSRGDMIDNQALYDAIIHQEIQGAAFDTISPEPVQKDHILLNLPKEYQDRLIFSPHIGGVTTSFFKRSQLIMWNNLKKVEINQQPSNIVNHVRR